MKKAIVIGIVNHISCANPTERASTPTESMKEYGMLVPLIVRPMEEDGHEIVSGHGSCAESKGRNVHKERAE